MKKDISCDGFFACRRTVFLPSIMLGKNWTVTENRTFSFYLDSCRKSY
jgi:hypothetical protein